ncbi:hypothetical protein D8674_031766 [Pyrus ussuriensis x Pyrus communis]|uniref:Uncharacterized protein n=1 Tax=Pyrus ussuriensis x Pyrus communis TaxID=2448454 RepID=A0A5N5EZX3_9ROSA|nr:hypothetical protein D8674_031766 [Pyrus ussuriensis x Pyrus communis]
MISFRNPETLPCLHDKVIAVATDIIAGLHLTRNRLQFGVPGILGGIIKGLKAGKEPHEKYDQDGKDDQDEIELHIDDVVIDGLVIIDGPAPSSSIQKNKTEKKDISLQNARKKLEVQVSTNGGLRSRIRVFEAIYHSQELRSGAEDFTSTAKELAKRMGTLEHSTMHILITYLLTSN